MDANATSDNRSRAWWDQVSHQFDPFRLAKNGTGPLAVRGLLGGGKELSATTMGKMLGYYRFGQPYGRQTIYKWERPERGERLPDKYAMTDGARECYRQLLSDLVQAVSGGRLRVWGNMGKRRWSFALQATCKCGQLFVVRRRNAVRCARCIRKGKR